MPQDLGPAGLQGAAVGDKRGNDAVNGAAGPAPGPAVVAGGAGGAVAAEPLQLRSPAHREAKLRDVTKAMFTMRLSNVPLHKAQKLRANHQVDPYAELLAGPEGLEPWKAVAKREEQLAAQMQDCVLEQLKEMPAWTTNFHRLYRKQTTAVFISDMTYASWIGEPGAPVHIVFIVGQGRHSPEVAGHKICVLRELVVGLLLRLEVPFFLQVTNLGRVHAFVTGSEELMVKVRQIAEEEAAAEAEAAAAAVPK